LPGVNGGLNKGLVGADIGSQLIEGVFNVGALLGRGFNEGDILLLG